MDRGLSVEQVKLVIFDCDGVMFDSKHANDAYYNHILAHFGKPPMNSQQSKYVHMHTADQSIAYLFSDDPLAEQALAYRHQISYFPFIPLMEMEPYLRPRKCGPTLRSRLSLSGIPQQLPNAGTQAWLQAA